MASPSSLSVSSKRLRSSGRYCSGPPRKATLPRMGRPHARPEMVCVTTDWNMDAAMSSLRAPSFSSGWTSVLANTPQRLAMGYMVVWLFASSLRPPASVFRSEAIWSMKAPVPPAQVPFMRCSMPLSK